MSSRPSGATYLKRLTNEHSYVRPHRCHLMPRRDHAVGMHPPAMVSPATLKPAILSSCPFAYSQRDDDRESVNQVPLESTAARASRLAVPIRWAVPRASSTQSTREPSTSSRNV